MLQITKPSLTLVHGPLPTITIDQNRTALIIVDMQYYAAHADHGLGLLARERGQGDAFAYYFAQVASIVPAIATVLAACRAARIEVIHLISEGHTRDGRDLGWEWRKQGVFTPKGAPDGAILPELAPQDDEMVIPKTVSGGFVGTALDFTLRSMDKRTLIVAGVATNQCVENTVRAASNLGYDVILLEDGCATYTEEWQRASLESLSDQFANVRRCQDVVREIDALGVALPAVPLENRS